MGHSVYLDSNVVVCVISLICVDSIKVVHIILLYNAHVEGTKLVSYKP